MARTMIAVEKQTHAKMKRIKKLTGLPMNKIADLCFAYLEEKLRSGELSTRNAQFVPGTGVKTAESTP